MRNTRVVKSAAPRSAACLSALALFLGGCGNHKPGDDNTGQATPIPHAKRVAFPQLSGPTLGGPTLDMASLKGEIIVLNVWGSWCSPCRKEAPDLERGYETYQRQGVAFVGLDTRDDVSQAQAFVTSSKIGYPNLVDSGSANLMTKLAGIVPLQGVPTTVIVDRAGKVAWIASMPIDYTTLTSGIDAVLAEQ